MEFKFSYGAQKANRQQFQIMARIIETYRAGYGENGAPLNADYQWTEEDREDPREPAELPLEARLLVDRNTTGTYKSSWAERKKKMDEEKAKREAPPPPEEEPEPEDWLWTAEQAAIDYHDRDIPAWHAEITNEIAEEFAIYYYHPDLWAEEFLENPEEGDHLTCGWVITSL